MTQLLITLVYLLFCVGGLTLAALIDELKGPK